MQVPSEVAVMILPNGTLFPQSMLPLYIFEPRYRQMLADSLEGHRMFCVAMQKPARIRETPAAIAGLGLIRASVTNDDGTSHLILQGLSRVSLEEVVQYKPYRIHRVRPLKTAEIESVVVDSLTARVRDLVQERLRQGFALPIPLLHQLAVVGLGGTDKKVVEESIRQFLANLARVDDAGQLTDLVACALLPDTLERQAILEAVEIESRLRYLIHFLLAQVQNEKGGKR
jgi:ATP-dependent Lon protease